VYYSKVFTFTKKENLFGKVEKGGTGFDVSKTLPDKIEHICPDYDLYNLDYSIGFLTRGCIRKCEHCIVPEKEGKIRAAAEITEFLRHDSVVIMDNNILANDHGIKQIEYIASKNIRVDFNQGLDARLIDKQIAKLLSKIKWFNPNKKNKYGVLRLACDSQEAIQNVHRAVKLLRWHNVKPSRYFVYCLIKDIPEALERLKALKGLYLEPFAQPFIDFKNNIDPTKEQKDLARWVNHTAAFNSVLWDDYKKRK